MPTNIRYGSDGGVELQGNLSQLIELTHAEPVPIKWEPLDRRAMDVEVRVWMHQIPGLSAPAIEIGAPWIRWGMRTGHGAVVFDEPQVSFPLKPGTFDAFADIPRTLPSLMPGRGLHFRVNAREFTLVLQNTGYFGVGYALRDTYGEFLEESGLPTVHSFPPVVMGVSFQPVEGLIVPVLPRYASVVPADTQLQWGNYVQVPAAAGEWRAFDDTGKVIAADYDDSDPDFIERNEAAAIRCLDPAGKLIAEVLPWELSEFQPLPLGIWAFHRPIPMGLFGAYPFNVEFR